MTDLWVAVIVWYSVGCTNGPVVVGNHLGWLQAMWLSDKLAGETETSANSIYRGPRNNVIL